MRIELTIDISRRWLILAGTTLLIAASLTMAGLAQAHGGSTDLIHTCYQAEKGSMRWVAPTDTCLTSEKPLDWSKGQVLRSPNGLYSLTMSDTGIVMQGPNSSVKIADGAVQVNATNVTIAATSALDVSGGTTAKLTSGGATTVKGGTLTLTGISGTDVTTEKDLKLSSGAATSITAGTSASIAATTATDVSGATSARIASNGATTVNGGTLNVTGTNGIAVATEKDLKLTSGIGTTITSGASTSITAGAAATVTAGTTAKITGGSTAEVSSPNVTLTGTSTTTPSVIVNSSNTTQVNASNEIELKTGDASAKLSKNGDITVSGKNIQATASATLGLRGSTVTLNGTCRPIALSGGVNSASVLGC